MLNDEEEGFVDCLQKSMFEDSGKINSSKRNIGTGHLTKRPIKNV